MSEQNRRLIYTSGDCEIDLAQRELRMGGVLAPVGSRAFDIIEALVQSNGGLVTKDDLMDRVWAGVAVEESSLRVHVSALRKALGPNREMLKTESGRGYRLLGNWTVRQEDAPQDNTSTGPVDFAPAAASPRPGQQFASNFPAMPSELIGRAAAAQDVRDLLSAYREVTLTGPGGIGKTTLALEAARTLFPGFAGDGRLVELASLSNPDLVPSAVARALGLIVVGDTISAEAVAGAIGEQKLLLVLDNCEHVIDKAAELTETIIRLCPGTTVLATSRELLRIDGEHVYRVPPLDVPRQNQADPDDVLGHSAVKLFIARTQALQSDFSLQGESLPRIAAICRRLDGIPLAIEFAAARAATLGLEQVIAHLDDRFALLTGGRRTALPRHQTLRATLDWSYGLLPDTEAAVLCRLAMFVGDFSFDAAIAVAGDRFAQPVMDCIANLVTKSLIVADPRDGAPRYRLLETTRLYALEKLRASGELQPAASRHAKYYRDLFATAEAESETRPQAEWRAIYGRHLDNVRAALDWAFSPGGNAPLGVALSIIVVPLWVQLSLLGECREQVVRALASLDAGTPADARPRMQLSAALAWALMYGVGRAREAGPAWATTLELAEQLDDTSYRMRALWGLCIDQFNNGDNRTALEYARRYAGLVENSTDTIDLVMSNRILATALHYFGDQNSARLHIDRALTHYAALAQKTHMVRLQFDQAVTAHYFQARILWLQGFADQSLRAVEQNIKDGNAVGHALSFCSVLGQGACPIAYLAGDFDAAARYGAMLLDHTERNPIRLWQIWARCFIGMVTAKRGDLAGGLQALRDGLKQAGTARFLPRFLLPLGELATCLGESGEIALALETIGEALARCETRDERWYVAEQLRIKGELLLLEGKDQAVAAAEACFERAVNVAREQGALFWELRGALSLARLRVKQDRPMDARRVLAPIYARFTEGFEIADMRAARALLESLAAYPAAS
jgi:predicted ATPase/DNA-binding winged helix-turn-helix (wHTH) protein